MKEANLQAEIDDSVRIADIRTQPVEEYRGDLTQMREKQYIEAFMKKPGNVKGGADNVRFTLHIMKRYNKPVPNTRRAYSYGAPADTLLIPEKSTVSKIVEGIVDPGPSIKLLHAQVKPMHFQKPSSSAFCEVLGPAACKECIEGTNRYTAHQVEKVTLPKMVCCPGTALVSPRITHVEARDNQRMILKKKEQKKSQKEGRDMSRERSVTLAIKRKVSKKKPTKSSDHSVNVILPTLSQGVPTLHKDGDGVRVKMYDRRWEARANDFFNKETRGQQGQDSSLHLSEQQQRLREMLEKIKYKSVVGGNHPR